MIRKSRTPSLAETSSTSSSILTKDIQRIVDKLKDHRHRDSTRRNYVVWKLFNKFFLNLDVKPNNWEDRLILFVGYLIDQKKQSATVKSYISAVKAVLLNIGVKLNYDTFLMSS